MDKNNIGKAERVIQASGCGPFQILVVFFVYGLFKIPATFTTMFMSYGNYNPGWRCLDDLIVSDNNGTAYDSVIGMNVTKSNNLADSDYEDSNNNDTVLYKQGSCPDYEVCQNIEFDPGASTIVTEWSLLCDKNWIATLIISIQMAGLLVGSLIFGYLGDSIGRKKVAYVALALNGVFNVITTFLESWQSFAAVRFLFGIVLSCIMGGYCVLPPEFLNTKWRGRMFPIPSWGIGGLVMSVTVMLCPDWRLLHVICAVLSFACCLTMFWVPESLRWLEIKGREEEFDKVAKKIIKMNKVQIDTEKNDAEVSFIDCNDKPVALVTVEKYSILDLFRKGYRLSSGIIFFLSMSASMIYYGIGFGVKAMSGDFYVNLIINYSIELGFCLFPLLLPNIIGRKKSSILFMSITAACLATSASFEVWASGGTRRVGTAVLALLAKTTVDGSWYILMNQITEIYPTAVRSLASGFGSTASKVGGILAPFLIPNDSENLYICYAVMAVLAIICCISTSQLPETKGKTLKETFDKE